VAAFFAVATQHDIDALFPFAVAGHRVAVQGHVEQGGNVLAGDTEQASLVLIDFDLDRFGQLAPVHVDV
jgi:hypothetical protein